MNNANENRFAAFIGIDWADNKYDVCLQAVDAEAAEYAVIVHSSEAIEDWALGLQRRFGSQPIAETPSSSATS